MILKLTERQWANLAVVLFLYDEEMLTKLTCLHDHNAQKDGYRYGCVPESLFKRLELPATELSSLAHTSGVPWVQSLSDALTEIIKNGEWYPVQDMIRECEEGVMEKAPYQEPRSEEEFLEFIRQMQESKADMPNAQDISPPNWFVNISQK